MAKKPRAARDQKRVVTNVIKLPQTKYKVWQDVEKTPYLKLHVASGYYYVRKFKAGKGELFRTTGEKRLGRAKTIADQMIADWIGGKVPTGKRKRMDQICDELERYLEQEAKELDDEGRPKRRKRTADKDKTYIPIIKTHFGGYFADQIDEQFIRDWERETGKKLKRGLGDIYKYLSKALTFAFERKYISRKPRIKNPDKRSSNFQVYTPEQIKEFLRFASQDLKDLLIIAAEVGLRPHENKGLEWSFIEIAKKAVIVRIPDWFEKRGKAREIIVGPMAEDILRRRFKKKRGAFVFPGLIAKHKPLSDCQLSRLWRRMLEAANDARAEKGLPLYPVGRKGGIRFHWLRHSFFTRALLEQELPLAQVAAYGGNSPKILFDRYLAKDAEKTRDVAQKMALRLDEEE